MTALETARARVEAGDPDRFAATMATPAALRDRLWPLYAVNLEIARAPWVSAEPMIGEMRLQWWVDSLEALMLRGHEPRHDIGPALAGLRPVAGDLIAIAEARRRDCWPDGFADAAALGDYIEATSGGLYAAAGQLLGADAQARAVLRDYGRAAGHAAWLLAVPEFERRGRAALPDAAPGAVAALARGAAADLARAAGALRRVPAPARLAALPGWEAAAILRRAARAPARVAEGHLRGSEFSRRFSLLLAALRG